MYRITLLHIILTIVTVTITCSTSFAQELNAPVYYSKKYLDLNVKSLTKYNKYTQKQQQKLLKKLKKKEDRFAKKLKRKDSTAYAQYQSDNVTYDSISRIKPDSIQLLRQARGLSHATIDSLKGVQRYIKNKTSKVNQLYGNTPGDNVNLNSLNTDLQYNTQVNDLISKRTERLKRLAADHKSLGSIKGIEQNVFYTKQRIQAVKGVADEPSKAEEYALEYLMGEKGFSNHLQPPASKNVKRMGVGMSVDDLEKMGFQTKRQLSSKLQNKFGNNLGSVQQRMGDQVSDYQDKLQQVRSTKNSIKQAKQSVSKMKDLNAPSFKVNPMRGKPLWHRIEKQYNWNTTRASFDGSKPAILNLSVMAGFKHTPKLTYGVGFVSSIGLGQNWNNVKISFEGLGLRTFTEWQWEYGIGAYAGYELLFRQGIINSHNNATSEPQYMESARSNERYQQSVLIGLTKRYQVNDKWSGAIQVLYDVWWKEKGLRSPIQLRFATIKN